ncbi:hypothetical protein CBM2623_B170435 [Cupriavidus taiwanensis]|nr:hypothetical protein CBM2608_B140503 [Cupriavidus taiwanensis]SPA33391.1 hypothetical protein CBM2623_B170435 [Cupriavidus taiwanensis]
MVSSIYFLVRDLLKYVHLQLPHDAQEHRRPQPILRASVLACRCERKLSYRWALNRLIEPHAALKTSDLCSGTLGSWPIWESRL